MLRVAERFTSKRNARVHHARSVDMHMQSVLVARSRDRSELRQWPHGAAATIVRVLDNQHATHGRMLIARPNRRVHLMRFKQTAWPIKRRDHAAAQSRGRARFVVNDVAVAMRDDFVARFTH